MKFIVAMEKNTCGIGFNGKMAWDKVKEDLMFFKEKTMGKNVVLGWKTYKGLITSKTKLDGRNVLVLSNKIGNNDTQYYTLPDLIKTITNMETKVFDECGDKLEDDVMICGGKQLYELMLDTPELNQLLTGGYITVLTFNDKEYQFDTDIKDFYERIKNDDRFKCEEILYIGRKEYALTVYEYSLK